MSRRTAVVGFALLAMIAIAIPAGASGGAAKAPAGKSLWHSTRQHAPSQRGVKPMVRPSKFRAYTLDRAGMKALLKGAPHERARAAKKSPLVVSLPAPTGGFQRFTLAQSQIMAPGLAAKHPGIKTYSGRGLDDPAATIHADLGPLGFHASVRSPKGAWYIDPVDKSGQGAYVSYYGRNLANAHGTFVERDADSAELAADRAYYHAGDTVVLNGSGFAADADVTITISDPEENFADRTVAAHSDESGAFTAEFTADPDGNLDMHVVTATAGDSSAMTSYQVVREDDPTVDPPTGDVLRTYRLALVTDPGYSAYFGGPANVTPAKVTLINRVSQVYEDDLSIRLQLIANNDLLNLNTWADATAPNGPCGIAACYAQSAVTSCSNLGRNRVVIGQIIGASNYDIGHLALGQPGGGVANLGVVGRAAKAQGCTGIPTPVGDFYAIDYVAHEMGHQFSGNHPFNGNQLNCSGGNRSGATSVETGSGSSIMAYAGICLTDDLQPHSDPYFSQRSLQEISTYTSGNQAAINEVQSVALRHFGGGNEVQVATFGPGFQPTSTIQPLTVNIGAAPSATQMGGADEAGNIVTIATGATGATHTLQVGDVVTISGVAVAGYNGTWTVTAVPSSRSFQYFNPTAGLARSGGGTITLNAPGLTESGNTVTVRTVAAHNRSVGDQVTITGANNTNYNGTWTITAVPSPRSFEFSHPTAGLPNAGAGTVTYTSPFRLRFNGNDSALIGSGGLAYSNASLQTAINGIAGFPGGATVAGATSTGFTVTYGGASGGVDQPSLEFNGLACGGCFASIEETNHGGANDSFRLNYNGNVSAPIVNGTNYTAAGIQTALLPLLPAGATATVAGFGGGGFNNTGFQVTFTGALALTNVPITLALQDFSAGATAFVNELDKGGAVDNKGTVTPTGNSFPAVTVPAQFTIPLRTPFALTGSATDADGDAMTYIWEQNDRGGAAGTALLSNTKTNGPLFAMFPISGQISETDTLLYNSPGENHVTTDPTRVFPDLQQIIDNNTNAETGACPTGPIAPPVPIPVKECFAEFLPTSDYLGFAGVNQSPLSLHMRFTARDGRGGVNAADTTLLLAPTAGPFLVTAPNTATSFVGGTTQPVTWNKANTDLAPVSTANVKISLSEDGGHTYPYVLAASTSNDGSEDVTLPNIATNAARVKVEAVGNVFFDISNADFSIAAVPVVTNDAPGGTASVQYSDALSPTVTISASDADSAGSDLAAVATGLPGGLSLADGSVSSGSTLPGTHTWTVAGNVTSGPGTYPVTVDVTDESGHTGSTSFTIVVTQEDADATYTGDMLAFTASGGSSANVVLRATIRDSAVIPLSGDTAGGDIRNATATFKEGATTLCALVPVSLINGDLRTGTAGCTATLGVGSHTIDVFVGGWYVGSGQGVVEVAQPNGSFVTGGGYLTIADSAGTYKADAGSKLHFGFNVTYKNQKTTQGHVNALFRRGGHTFQIKSTAIDSLGVGTKSGWGVADFRAKANLTDITTGASVGSGLTLQMTLTDKGDPGGSDTIGLTIWQGSKLIFSSEWNGAKTLERTLTGGNLVVH